jgi:hypothetical protein
MIGGAGHSTGLAPALHAMLTSNEPPRGTAIPRLGIPHNFNP